MALWENDDIQGWVIYGGSKPDKFHGINVLPWNKTDSLFITRKDALETDTEKWTE